MKRENFIGKVIFLFVFLIGIFFGMFLDDFSLNILFDKNVVLSQLITWCLTIIIALSIPSLINRSIDNSKNVKFFLVKEIESIRTILLENEKIFLFKNIEKGIEENDKRLIMYNFDKIDKAFDVLDSQLKLSFYPSFEIIDSLKNDYFKYFNFITGDEGIFSQDFVLDERFLKEHISYFSLIDSNMKISILRIFNL